MKALKNLLQLRYQGLTVCRQHASVLDARAEVAALTLMLSNGLRRQLRLHEDLQLPNSFKISNTLHTLGSWIKEEIAITYLGSFSFTLVSSRDDNITFREFPGGDYRAQLVILPVTIAYV